MNRLYISLAPLVLMIVAGCESSSVDREPARRLPDRPAIISDDDLQSLLSAAENTNPSRANELRIRAAELATENGDLEQAIQILSLVHNLTVQSNARRYVLLHAEIAIQQEDTQTALGWLRDRRIIGASLSQLDQIELGQLRARAYYAGRSYVASARERIFIDALLTPDERLQNHEKIFSSLLELPAKSLANHAHRAITSELRGWLSLAAMTRLYQNNPLLQLKELNRWRTVWSDHPAARNLPASLRTLSKVVENQPKTIALLLPLRGDLGLYGQSIRDGIIAARFVHGSMVKMDIYDTSAKDIRSLVYQAVDAGAEIIIGPLRRELVNVIANMESLPVPVLALNRTNNGISHPDLYQFGLAPEDEMVQVADRVFRERKRNAIAIYPDNDWGARNYEAFRNRWISLGGNIIDTTIYAKQRDYSKVIKSLLDIDQSEKRATDLRRILGQRFEFTPRRRKDIDFVFLLGSPTQARGINPTLAFYYAEDIPVYSTSHINEYSDSRIDTIDLNGIRFCDIPWKLTDTNPVKNPLQLQWSNSKTSLAPFYALGVDAFKLYPRLQQLKEIDGAKIFGATGVLRLNDDNIVVRKLMWAQFTNGRVVAEPIVVQSSNL